MNLKRNIKQGFNIATRYVAVFLLAVLLLNSCKPKQVVTDTDIEDKTKTEELQKLNELKTTLNSLLVDAESLSVSELEQKIAALKALNSTDAEVLDLIAQLETKLSDKKKKIALDQERKKKEAEREASFEVRFPKNLDKLAVVESMADSDKLIAETLTYFSSPEALVLIIISKEDGYVDYDEPTTIKKYLEYVKDQKASKNKVDKIVLDDNGKIKELELIKK